MTAAFVLLCLVFLHVVGASRFVRSLKDSIRPMPPRVVPADFGRCLDPDGPGRPPLT